MSDQTFDPTSSLDPTRGSGIPFRLNEQPETTPDEKSEGEYRSEHFFVPVGMFHRELPQVANIVELIGLVYYSFYGRYKGLDVVREYGTDYIVVPMANGQVGRVAIGTLSDLELTRWREQQGWTSTPEKRGTEKA